MDRDLARQLARIEGKTDIVAGAVKYLLVGGTGISLLAPAGLPLYRKPVGHLHWICRCVSLSGLCRTENAEIGRGHSIRPRL